MMLFYIIPRNSFKVGSIDFIKGQKYPVFMGARASCVAKHAGLGFDWDINGFLVLYTENGSFNLGNRCINQLINEWGLKVTFV